MGTRQYEHTAFCGCLLQLGQVPDGVPEHGTQTNRELSISRSHYVRCIPFGLPRITDCPSSIFSVSPTPALTIPLLFPLAASTAVDVELVINL